MGLDGGTIASRSDVLRRSSWRLTSKVIGQKSTRGGQLAADFTAAQTEERVSERERREAAWISCALTGRPLGGSIVACSLGLLYNKESVVQFLLSVAGVEGEGEDKWMFERLLQLKPQFPQITSRHDVFELRKHSELRCSSAAEGEARHAQVGAREQPGNEPATGSMSGQAKNFLWTCPVTGVRLDGPLSSAAIRTCGHVITHKALKQIAGRMCPVCSEAYSETDLIPLNRPSAEVAELREEVRKRKAEEKRSKQERKSQRVKSAAAVAAR